jgi:hypothetical protein
VFQDVVHIIIFLKRVFPELDGFVEPAHSPSKKTWSPVVRLTCRLSGESLWRGDGRGELGYSTKPRFVRWKAKSSLGCRHNGYSLGPQGKLVPGLIYNRHGLDCLQLLRWLPRCRLDRRAQLQRSCQAEELISQADTLIRMFLFSSYHNSTIIINNFADNV